MACSLRPVTAENEKKIEGKERFEGVLKGSKMCTKYVDQPHTPLTIDNILFECARGGGGECLIKIVLYAYTCLFRCVAQLK